MRRKGIRGAGVGLCALGTLALLFVAYQLWGTGLTEHAAQNRLRNQLESQLAHRSVPVTIPGRATSAASGDTSGGSDTISGTTGTASTSDDLADGQPFGLLTIPRIGMNDDVVVEGVSDSDLRQGPGHYPGSGIPGQPGNVAIAGHRTTYAAPFYNLNELQPGDPIVLRTLAGTFQYAVSGISVVDPGDSSVLASTANSELTLTTCNPRYSASQRLIVVALLQHSTPVRSVYSPFSTHGAQPRRHTPAVVSTLTGDTSSSNVGGAVLWGLLVVAIAGLALLSWRRWRRRLPRSVAVALGTPCFFLTLFVFFGHLSALLPASF